MKDTWKRISQDPDNPELKRVFEHTANHIIKEAQQIYTLLERWLPEQKTISETDVKVIEEIDEMNERISDVLFKGLITTKNFGAIRNDSALIKGNRAQQLMNKNGWKVIDIQGSLYKMDRQDLLDLVSTLLEAADKGKEEANGYSLQSEAVGLLAIKKDSPEP